MCSKSYFVLFFVFFVTDFSDGQRDKKFFRKDYKYLEATQSFYKIHTLHRTWKDAKRMCALEGASLFYPEDDNEAQAVLTYWNATQPFRWVFIGISDLIAKGVFETIDGIPIADVYNNWGPGEPNDANNNEDCVILRQDGTLNDDRCFAKFPFICKKSLVSLEWNQECNMPNLGTTLEDSGYTTWGYGQPDGASRGVDERCGSMFYNGHLNDIRCDRRCFFICEHEVDTLSSNFDDRFGDRKR